MWMILTMPDLLNLALHDLEVEFEEDKISLDIPEKRRLQHDDTEQENGKNQGCCVLVCFNYTG